MTGFIINRVWLAVEVTVLLAVTLVSLSMWALIVLLEGEYEDM
jgi:hypothetical protein